MEKRILDVILVLAILLEILNFALEPYFRLPEVSVNASSLEAPKDDTVYCINKLTSKDTFIVEREFNKTFEGKVTEYLEGYSSCEFLQTVSTGIVNSSSPNSIKVNAICDFYTKRCLTDYYYTDSLGTKEESYYEDRLNAFFASKVNSDTWEKADLVTKGLNFELNMFDNVAQMYNYVFSNFDLPYGTKGEVIDNYVYFEYEEPVKPEDMGSIQYTSLGNKTRVMSYEIVDGTYRPSILKMQLCFSVDGVDYISTTIIDFVDFSNKTLDSPMGD